MKNKNSIALVYSNRLSMIYIQDSDITYVAEKGRKNKSIFTIYHSIERYISKQFAMACSVNKTYYAFIIIKIFIQYIICAINKIVVFQIAFLQISEDFLNSWFRFLNFSYSFGLWQNNKYKYND